MGEIIAVYKNNLPNIDNPVENNIRPVRRAKRIYLPAPITQQAEAECSAVYLVHAKCMAPNRMTG